jgi:hypothetical protein
MAQVSTAGGSNATVVDSFDTVTGWAAAQPASSSIGAASVKTAPRAPSLCRHAASSAGSDASPFASIRGRVHRRRQIFRCACRKWQQDHKEKEKPSHAHRKEMGHARRPGNGAGHHIA